MLVGPECGSFRPRSRVFAMLSLKLNQLKPGMVLSRDVTNFSGVLLLKSGKSLKAKEIKNFKAWGIPETFVQEPLMKGVSCQEKAPPIDPKLLQEAEAESAALFRHSNASHPIVVELKRLCTMKKVKQRTSSIE